MDQPTEPPTPEHDKLIALNGANDTVGEFLEWLVGRYVLAEWHTSKPDPITGETDSTLERADATIIQLLGEYFKIDNDVLNQEKAAILEYIRAGGL
jgi:hypothetical protein